MSASGARSAARPAPYWTGSATGSEERRRPAVRGGLKPELALKTAAVFAVLALTVLDRFGLRVTGETSISIGMIGMYAMAAAMVITGGASVNGRAALAYVAVLCTAGLSLMVNAALAPPPNTSTLSFLLMALLYAPLCLSLRPHAASPELWRWTLRLYVAFALLVAVAGIAQFFVQFVYSPPWLFDFTPLIPEAIQTSRHWATVHSTGDWAKSNGFFMREPSFFSLLMALGIVCELSLARRKWAIALLAGGLLLSYSGSGLLCLGVALLFPLGRGTLARIAAFAVLGAGVVLTLGDALNLTYTLERVREFTSTGSSAYCRFIYPTVSALEQLNSSPWTSFIGHGPGSIVRMGGTCPAGFDTAFSKALFEYGLLGLAGFGVLVAVATNRAGGPARIRAACMVTWLLLTGLLAGETLLFIYLVSALWPEGMARAAAPGGHAPAS